MSSLDGKIILITGGTGSFGTRMAEVLLKEHNPKSIRLFSRGEKLQQDSRTHFNDNRKLRYLLGDIRDRDRIYRALNGVDIVIHAAAQKQVDASEYNPIEAVKTNIFGSINVIDAAIDNNVEKVIALSSDKAASPVNLYGATKMVMERLIIRANAYAPSKSRCCFSCVRYGNIAGSRGSVVPIFLRQKKGGVLTITDERMTRFWLSLDRAVCFVISSLERMVGGEIFIPVIPSMKITDLADVIAPEATRRIVGVRPSEKLHEALLTNEESTHTLRFKDYFIIKPNPSFKAVDLIKGGKLIIEGFTYTSDINDWWLSKKELKKMIGEIELE